MFTVSQGCTYMLVDLHAICLHVGYILSTNCYTLSTNCYTISTNCYAISTISYISLFHTFHCFLRYCRVILDCMLRPCHSELDRLTHGLEWAADWVAGGQSNEPISKFGR